MKKLRGEWVDKTTDAFFAGIEHSQYIIAINTDRRAPIMSKCDLAIVDDAREVIDKLALLVGNTGDI